MKPGTALAVLLAVPAGVGGGVLLERQVLSAGAPQQQAGTGPRILYWWDPMIPDFKSDKPGKSPMGMDMVPVYEGQEPGRAEDKGTVTVSSAAMNNLGVRTAAVERATLTPAVETFGSITFDESRTAHLHVRGKGWIERLHTRVLGEHVERGQLLMEVFSPDLITAAYEYVREAERGPSGNTEGARRKLTALGVSDRQIEEVRRTKVVPERIKVYAPQTGVVEALGVAEGMYVESDITLMSIIDHASVWVMAEVLESQVGLVSRGMQAEVRVASQPGRTWSGTVDYVYPELRPDTRTARLRIRLDNADRALQPNMFASVRLAARAREGVIAIPNGALIRTGQADRAVLALGDGRFKPVPVKAGLAVGDMVEITEGLKEGDRVVTSAQFLIDSESSLTAGFASMQDAGMPMAKETAAPPMSPAMGEGEVTAIAADGRKVTISHGPIPDLSWPAMAMEFGVAPGVSVQGLAPGARVRFGVVKAPDDTYTAATIERLGGAGGTP
ncbi:efflux RND transporter periplasmic adaptor subunit [Azospirillum sp. BE72]|uniref:efflux RND transporter periplasmic adaptor subunit n=1 Tax=Azospirillum sp. BE72 TaxID=2817776 RepID=UPI002864F5ED|nr:efflux RND transporter periplasmic adaptor subunit [Azospirillum sp. BE72]MDR6775605.1 Cu(I)/Ag(I) efflux system membrane fusion protein [Azospirillum sp. BE72]